MGEGEGGRGRDGKEGVWVGDFCVTMRWKEVSVG